jgi:thiamine transport system permease protein
VDRRDERLSTRPGGRGQRLALAGAAALPLAFLVVFFAVPVGGMLRLGFWPQGGSQLWPDLGGFADVLGRSRTQRVIGFTFGMAAAATALTVLLGVPGAYVLHRLAVPGRAVLRAVVTLPFVLPTVVVGVMFRSLLADGGPLGGLGLDGSPVAILAAFVFFNTAVVVRTVGVSWEALDHRAEQAAAALGAAPATVFRTVTLPALAPAVWSAASVVFLFCSTAFGVVLVLGGLRYGTVETEIYLLTTTLLDLRGAAVLSVLQFVAVVAMLALTAAIQRRAAPGTRRPGGAAAALPVTRAAIPALVATAVVLALVVVPVGAMVLASLRRDGQWTLANYSALAGVSRASGLVEPVWAAVGTSLRVAVDATLLAVTLGLLVAVVVSRRARSASGAGVLRVLDAAFMVPLGISAVTVGFGFLVTLDRPPLDLRSSPILVPIAQAMVALPLVVRTLAPVLRGIDDRQRQAAATLGASPWRALLAVDLPAIRRPLLAATGFALAVSLGEFGATSFLIRPDRQTLPIVVYQLIGRPGAENFGTGLAAAVVLAVLTSTAMAIVERLRVDSVGAF